MLNISRVLGAALVLVCAHPSLADSPLLPPSIEIMRSKNRRFFAQTNPTTNTTTVYRAASGRTRPRRLWQMKGWFRSLFVADDGRHLVTAYNGFNLLSLPDARPQTIMLRFFRRGQLVRAVTLGELGLNRSNMRRTVSHYSWGRAEGFDERERFAVSTEDGRHLLFNFRTGRLVR